MLNTGYGEGMSGLPENTLGHVYCEDREATEGHQDSLDGNVGYVEY